MPIYEFHCPSCNTIFKFFSRSINTTTKPHCPKCSQDILSRQFSTFAFPGKAKEPTGGLENLPIDESKMEHAMHKLMGEADNCNEDDPRKAAELMQKFSNLTGLTYNDTIQEALSRMESGEDPEQIESQMGEAFNEEDPFVFPDKKKHGSSPKPPSYDDRLYEM